MDLHPTLLSGPRLQELGGCGVDDALLFLFMFVVIVFLLGQVSRRLGAFGMEMP